MLERIVAEKRAAVTARKTERPLDRVREGLSRSDRSLAAALTKPRTGLIAECKKASPSRGLLRADFDPVATAAAYAPVADAISVVTDAPFFQGRLEWLARVREAVALPVLCKDFIVDPYQVYEARGFGADAVLLMLSVLGDDAYLRCRETARSLGMDVLTEVHDARELERAIALDAAIIGVNNRNLQTLAVDLAVSERLAGQIPAGRVRVSESGLFDHDDARRLRGQVDAFLVGTAFVASGDPGGRARELMYGRVKVCGLTRTADAVAAHRAGAVFGGMIFAESPRRVDQAQADLLRRSAPLRWVGVYVDDDPQWIARQAAALDLAAVQLHGDEPPEVVAAVREAVPPGCEVWQVARVQDHVPAAPASGATRLLLDTYRAQRRGGTGEAFDWTLLDGHPARREAILSGGLRPDNAARADAVGAWALDVNSGVETAPGEKSTAALEAFFGALRGGRAIDAR